MSRTSPPPPPPLTIRENFRFGAMEEGVTNFSTSPTYRETDTYPHGYLDLASSTANVSLDSTERYMVMNEIRKNKPRVQNESDLMEM